MNKGREDQKTKEKISDQLKQHNHKAQGILTIDSCAEVVARKNTVISSIACSGKSRRNLIPISAKADKRAT